MAADDAVGAHLHRLRSTLARIKYAIELGLAPDSRASVSDYLVRVLGADWESRGAEIGPIKVIDDDERLAALLVKKLRGLGFVAEITRKEDARERDGIRLLDWSVAQSLGVGSIDTGRIVLMSGTRLKETSMAASATLLKPFSEDELIAAVLTAAAEGRE